MTPAQEEFIEKCPAWARHEGIECLAEWQIVERLMPLPWSQRYDQLGRIKAGLEHVLACWDAMSENSGSPVTEQDVQEFLVKEDSDDN